MRKCALVSFLFSVFCVLPKGRLQAMEEPLRLTPKLPFSREEHLLVEETEEFITVSGATFKHSISRGNGLLARMEVMNDLYEGEEGVLYPDLMLSEALDDFRGSEYLARLNRGASVEVVRSSPEVVIIEADCAYLNAGGETFPMFCRLEYQFFIDGVIIITLTHRAVKDLQYTWFAMASGSVPAALCRLMCRMDDMAWSRGTNGYHTGLLAGEGKVFSGEFIPWFWVGNMRTGIDVYMWEYTEHAWNAPDGRRTIPAELGRAGEMCRLLQSDDRLRWEGFVTRNVPVWMKQGETKVFHFGIGITPPKLFDGNRSLRKTKVEGPFQFSPRFDRIPAERINEIAEAGYELVIGSSSCPSGYYHPVNEGGFRANMKSARKKEMVLVPYTTLTDLNRRTDAYREYSHLWAVKPMTTHRNKTQLMCHGCAEWRRYWKDEITRFIETYQLPGIYTDMWYGKLACENYLHGCGAKGPRSVNYIWTREMLCHVYNTIRSGNPDAVVVSNTNLMPQGMICSMVDTRVVGEAVSGLGEESAKDGVTGELRRRAILFNSFRLGSGSNIIWHGFSDEWSLSRKTAFAVMNNFVPQSWDDKKRLHTHDNAYWQAVRYIEPAKDGWHLGLTGNTAVHTGNENLLANLVTGSRGALISLVNWTSRPQQCKGISARIRMSEDASCVVIAIPALSTVAEGKPDDVLAGMEPALPPFSSVTFLVVPEDAVLPPLLRRGAAQPAGPSSGNKDAEG